MPGLYLHLDEYIDYQCVVCIAVELPGGETSPWPLQQLYICMMNRIGNHPMFLRLTGYTAKVQISQEGNVFMEDNALPCFGLSGECARGTVDQAREVNRSYLKDENCEETDESCDSNSGSTSTITFTNLTALERLDQAVVLILYKPPNVEHFLRTSYMRCRNDCFLEEQWKMQEVKIGQGNVVCDKRVKSTEHMKRIQHCYQLHQNYRYPHPSTVPFFLSN